MDTNHIKEKKYYLEIIMTLTVHRTIKMQSEHYQFINHRSNDSSPAPADSSIPIVTRMGENEALQISRDVSYDYCGITDFSVNSTLPRKQINLMEYNSYSSRLNSFINWPQWANQAPNKLAAAGFYYTGKGDKTKCFCCKGILKHWEKEDIPWEQHALYFKDCSYLQLIKGSDFIQKVISESVEINTGEEEQDILKSEKNTKENSNCGICFNGEKNTCFVPCGHLVACGQCASSTNKCFICRKHVHTVLRVYFN